MTKMFKLLIDKIYHSIFILLTLLLFFLPNKRTAQVLLVIGTRPEAIKMIPVYLALKNEKIPTLLCSTGQHKELLDDIFKLFKIKPDFDFKMMKENQDLFDITQKTLINTKNLFKQVKPSLVVVQGDTTSAMSAALAAFYLKIPDAHIESGLRSKNINRPFPEELNRRIISLISSYHFAPTKNSIDNLLKEGIDKKFIFYTGNTICDSLLNVITQIQNKQIFPSHEIKEIIDIHHLDNNKILLFTCHRRETLTKELKEIFLALKEALQKDSKLLIIYPTHPNPLIKKLLNETKLNECSNIKIFSPLSYYDMVYLLTSVDGILTDSGGIQEEGVSLNKPVIVLRNETERLEGIESGFSKLVGTKKESIISAINEINPSSNESLSFNPIYGDGQAGKKIAAIIKKYVNK